jgi:hypothetical protein
MKKALPVSLQIVTSSRRDGMPSVNAGDSVTIRLTYNSRYTNVKIHTGTVYIVNPFGRTISKVPFRFGKTNFGQFSLPTKKTLLSGVYTVLVAFQETKIKKIVVDKDPYKGPPEKHHVMGVFFLKGGYPSIMIHRVNYTAILKNTTPYEIGNLNAFIAMPPSIPPRQDILDVKFFPTSGREQNDLTGNNWIQFSHNVLPVGKNFKCSYIALIRNCAVRYNLSVATTSSNIPESIARFTKPENFVESHHHLIKDLARDLARTHKTPIQYAKAAMQTVTKKIRYTPQKYERGAAYAIENRVGDCTEYAALFTALCRANKIPARLEAGFAFNGKAWERHAWSQIWLRGQWIPVDPTWHGAMGLLGVTNRHLPLIIGNWMDTRIRQEFKISWHYRARFIDEKKSEKSEPKINTSWKVQRVVSVPESETPRLSAAPALLYVKVPDAVPRGSQLPVNISLTPIRTGTYPLEQIVMTATLSDGLMDQIVAIESFAPRLRAPVNMRLNVSMPHAPQQVILNLRLWADQKPTSTMWQKTIGLI